MIRNFKDPESEKIFQRELSHKFPQAIQRQAFRKLRMLNRSESLDDLRVSPNNRLEHLQGRRKGQYSIHINLNWRICFEWEKGEASSVEIVDFH